MSEPDLGPPVLPGFETPQLLGSGGFADVYLYDQLLPRRQVAIKVLHDGVSKSAARTFASEANVMAQLSAHPAIVTILQADVADDGRPYLVMEYYPGVNLSQRCRAQPLSIDEALDISIQIAGAVETAHRAGIIHRDIKPANILTSAFGKPALTDFGISAVKASSNIDDENSGLSIPWSAPEAIEDPMSADERSDVYSLAATLFTLLAGRSPFEIPGQRNRPIDLVTRISGGRTPYLERSGIPSSLHQTLSRGLDRDPANRPQSAEAFARSLQEVEIQMRLPVTPLDLIGGDEPPTEISNPTGMTDLGDATRVRGTTVLRLKAPARRRAAKRIEAQREARHQPTPVAYRSVPTSQVPDANVSAAGAVGTTNNHAKGSAGKSSSGVMANPRTWIIAAVVVAAVVGGFFFFGGSDSSSSGTSGGGGGGSQSAAIPAPQGLVIDRTGETTAEATWTSPEPRASDTYRWRRTDPNGKGKEGETDALSLTLVDVPTGSRPCLEVWILRDGATSAKSASACSAT